MLFEVRQEVHPRVHTWKPGGVQLTSCRVAIAVMRELLGPELACERLASDTPLGHGSVYQAIHADGPGLTPDPDGIPTQGAFVSRFRLN